MDCTAEIRDLMATLPRPPCADLTPCELLEADSDGYVRVRFEAQPAFTNHFGNIQGGFAVGMLDVPITLAAFAKTRQFLPTVEIKASYVAPAKIGPCTGEGRVIRAGKSLVFLEGKLFGPDGQLAVHATATTLIR